VEDGTLWARRFFLQPVDNRLAVWFETLTGQAFGTLQRRRHIADYDNGFVWRHTDAVAQVDLASAAFADWRAIGGTEAAQDF
jgi:hypothetical protein